MLALENRTDEVNGKCGNRRFVGKMAAQVDGDLCHNKLVHKPWV